MNVEGGTGPAGLLHIPPDCFKIPFSRGGRRTVPNTRKCWARQRINKKSVRGNFFKLLLGVAYYLNNNFLNLQCTIEYIQCEIAQVHTVLIHAY